MTENAGKHEGKNNSISIDSNLRIIFGITLMAVLGVSSITPAFPRIVKEFQISAGSIGLLITVFTLPGVILTPVLGVLADRFGRKTILVPALLLFGIAGGACVFAGSFDVLLILRFFQGVGAASLGSLNVTLIGDLYPGNKRTTAMGYNASVLSIGTASYPLIGGALAMFAWFYPFALPVLAIPLGFIVMYMLKNPEPENTQTLKAYIKSAWQSLKSRKVLVLFIASIFTFIILYGPYLTYFPIFIENAFSGSSLVIGIIMSSMSVTTAITSSQLGKLAKSFSKKDLMRAAFILYAIALIITPFVPGKWYLIIPAVTFGLGQGVNIPSLQTLLAELAPIEYRAAFMSVNGMVLRLGQTLGPVIMGLFYAMWGIEITFFAGAGFAVLMFFILLAYK